MNPTNVSKLVLEVVAELEQRLPSQSGVSADDIETLVTTRANQLQMTMSKQKVLESISREVDMGRLQRLKNNMFKTNDTPWMQGNQQNGVISPLSNQRGPPSMVPPQRSTDKHSPNGRKSSPYDKHGARNSPARFNLDGNGDAPSQKRSRLDPFAHVPGISNLSNLAKNSSCRICLLPLSSPVPNVLRGLPGGGGATGVPLTCATCRFSIHSTCAGYNQEQAIRYHETGWMCPSCRTCTFCGFGPSTSPGDGVSHMNISTF